MCCPWLLRAGCLTSCPHCCAVTMPPLLLSPPPASQPGERLAVRCSHTDVRMGMWRLDVVPDSQLGRYHLQDLGGWGGNGNYL